ncbi:hypothetical protein A9P82_01080 [Arachidicoccus ginsenosidimutans]|uniref:SusC/RagA family TonB-linked outer membrane protein n=1 Tax=Arachidicoccus sp. BS20 TaxID=1850526 RepID=UPI0007F1090E|nr:SusC/RagA family TonB-linked outer membrane protein [Arachidicoccus sp. BS20]ANI88035.1 hypothetical protein A9P82_01080 [Arachidicoccus sp. BS20]
MKFNYAYARHGRHLAYKKRRFAKFIGVSFTLIFLLCGSRVFSQEVSLNVKEEKLAVVLKQVSQQTGYQFIASPTLLNTANPVTIDAKHMELLKFLSTVFNEQPITYTVKNKIIIVIRKPEAISSNGKVVSQIITSQSNDLNGKVTNEAGEPLANATVIIANKHYGTLTNTEGLFHLSGIKDAQLEIEVSYTGFGTKKLKVKTSDFINVMLRPSDNELDVVQTMAYSKTSMRYNTGTAYTVTAKDIEKNPVPNVLQAIQGRVPGMFIQQLTGTPGGAFNVTIRGRSTIDDQSPLYVIDGVAYPAGGSNGGSYGSGTLPLYKTNVTGVSQSNNPLQGGNALNYLDPSQIESINVLEGADATAIYGSRGAYGVVIITTKHGSAGKPKLNLNTYSGISARGSAPKLLNTQQYLNMRREAFLNDSANGNNPLAAIYGAINPALNSLFPTYDLTEWDTTKYTDWQKYFSGTNAMTTKLNATYSGGTQNLNFIIGAFYNDLQSVQRGKGHDRSGGMNYDIRSTTPDKKLTVDFSGNFSTDVNTMVPFDFTNASINLAPNAPSLFADGKLNWDIDGFDNPAKSLFEQYHNTTNNLLANLSFNYVPVKGLTIHLTGGYNLLSAKEFRGFPSEYFNPTGFSTSEVNSVLNYYTIHTLTLEPNVNYTTLLGGAKGRLNITAGGTLQDRSTDNHYLTGSGFLSDALMYNPASAAQVNTSEYYNLTPNRYAGYFGVINYTYDNKYILNLNGRRDGSTRFGSDKQFGNFGSIGGIWIISDEKWFKNNISFIDFAKLRANYGTVGGDGIGDYQFVDIYTLNSNSYQGSQGLSPTRIANPNLQWESNKESEVGLTLQFLKDRITLDGDFNNRKTSNQLIQQPISTVTGFSQFPKNSPAVIRTYGIEFSLSTKNIESKNFSWRTMLNMTIPKSKLVSFPGLAQLQNFSYQIGKPTTGILLYKYDSVDSQTGQYIFTNAAGDSGPFSYGSGAQLDQTKDRTVFKNLGPKFYGGFENTFSYKGLSLSFMFYFVDEDGPTYAGSLPYQPGYFNQNITTEAYKEMWQKPGDKATLQGASQSVLALTSQNNFRFSTGAYSNAAFVRLSNANIAYTFPPKWLKKAGISRLQVYASGQNLLTISKYGGLDPENLSPNLMPPLRIFTGGLNITF